MTLRNQCGVCAGTFAPLAMPCGLSCQTHDAGCRAVSTVHPQTCLQN